MTPGGSESRPIPAQTIHAPRATRTSAFASAANTSARRQPKLRSGVAGPQRKPGGEDGEPERERVRKHVHCVREQRERPGHEPGGDLEPGEAEHEHERCRQSPLLSSVRMHDGTVARQVSDLFMIAPWLG